LKTKKKKTNKSYFFKNNFAKTPDVSATTPDLTQKGNAKASVTPKAVHDELRKKRDVPEQYGKAIVIAGSTIGGCIFGGIQSGLTSLIKKATGASTDGWGKIAVDVGYSCVASAAAIPVGLLAMPAVENGIRSILASMAQRTGQLNVANQVPANPVANGHFGELEDVVVQP